jgi:hypothetical protein
MDVAQLQAPAQRPRLEVVRVLEQYRHSSQLDRQGHCDRRLATINRVLDLLTACRTGRLGSHVTICQGCERLLIALNSCNNRHCPCCGQQRRLQWQQKMSGLQLECNYFHVVFTLPHELNPLLLVNPRLLYRLLMRSATDVLLRTCQRELDCVPGMVLALHGWGQRMNLHVHCHVILTAGGLSSDGQHWRTIPVDHPALGDQVLAELFRQMFVRRLFHRLTRNRLLWPTREHLPADPTAIGLDSVERFYSIYGDQQSLDEPAESDSDDLVVSDNLSASNDLCSFTPWQPDGPGSSSDLSEGSDRSQSCRQCGSGRLCSWCRQKRPLPPALSADSRSRQRELTEGEARLLAVLKRKSWMVNCQPPPTEFQGPEAIIRYLANYVTGTCIHNARLLDHEDGRVSIRVKDYKSGQVQRVSFEAEDFVRRFVLHILPPGLRRMRYSGLFTPAGLGKRLELARLLIARQRDGGAAECDVENVESKSESSANQSTALEGDREEDSLEEVGFDEDQEAVACKTCSRCQARMQVLGRLRGRDTLAIVRLADGIDERLAEWSPLLRLELIAELIKILAGAWRLQDLPAPIRDSMRYCPTDYLEISGLRALLERKLPMSMRSAQAEEGVYTSGVPPPQIPAEVIHVLH